MDIPMETVLAMAVAAVAEEEDLDADTLRVRSFREIPESAVAQYAAAQGIGYHKYQLGDERNGEV